MTSDVPRCVICETGQMRQRDQYLDRRRGLTGVWNLFECSNCGVNVLLPTPTAAQLNEYYSHYSSGDTVNPAPSRGARYPLLRKSFHWLSGDVDPRDFIQPEKGSRILDYGCGQAGYLIDFHAQGFAVSGAEMSTTVVEVCQQNGLDVRQVTNPDEIPFPNESFDIVYLMQVFEHLRDPHIFMSELARVLSSGGSLYLAVPNSRSIWRRVFKKNWVSGWFAPFHLFHYDRRSLSVLAAKHGFELLESWSTTPASWFRLNLKAWLHAGNNRLDGLHSFLDMAPARYSLMLALRLIEIFVRERDCLVIKLVKRKESQ